MNTEQIKQWFEQVRGIDREINLLISARQDTAAYNVESARKFEKRLDRRINELFDIKIERESVIEQIDDTTLKTILYSYYIEGKTWEQTAAAVGKSYAYIHRALLPKALAAAYEIIKARPA